MGKVVDFPKHRSEAELKVLYLQSYIRNNMVDLSKIRQELVKTQKEIRRLKAKATLRLVQNDDGNGKTS